MTDATDTVAESEFVVRLDLAGVPSREQRDVVMRALRKVADAIEDYPMTDDGQVRGGRRSFDGLGVVARWVWQS